MTERQVRVLLSGGIGAGKTVVGDMLRARGALVIDADQVGHRVLEPGGTAYEQVVETWPDVEVDGRINRTRLADIVFRDSTELERLEALTHGAIRSSITEMLENASEDVVVVEVPLLSDFMGAGWIRVVVDADPGTRLERLLARGLDRDDVARRMASQPSREKWNRSAEMLIDNSGDLVALREQVEVLWQRLLALLGGSNLPPPN